MCSFSEQQQPLTPEQIAQIQQMAKGLQYGTVTLVFQDGVLIQLDRSEKIRLPGKKKKDQ